MNDERHDWAERLSDYLDGHLPADERDEVEAHLAGCDACRAVLDDLRTVVARARSLPDTMPGRDLWLGIAREIGAGVPAAPDLRVIPPNAPGDAARDAMARPARRFSLSAPQLAAAAVLLMALSATATWWAGPGLAIRASERTAVAPTATGPLRLVSDEPAPPEGLVQELESLEQALTRTAETLDPNTARLIEKNLAVIERAIEESRQALSVDPENGFLAGHLDRAYQRKLSYLREAAQLVDWSG